MYGAPLRKSFDSIVTQRLTGIDYKVDKTISIKFQTVFNSSLAYVIVVTI